MITLSPGPGDRRPVPLPRRPVSAHVTDEQVEAVALRGFLQGVETEEDWLVYRAELAQHLSPYAVEEVGHAPARTVAPQPPGPGRGVADGETTDAKMTAIP